MHKVAAVVGAGLLVTAATTTTAYAADTSGGSHCTVGVAPSGTSSPNASQVRCFGTLSEAVAFATGGRVQLPANATVVTEAQSSRPGVNANPLLGIEYEDSNYGGSTWTLYGSSGTGCYNGVSYGYYTIGQYGWGDKISSAKAYSGCTGVHYENSNATGSIRNCTCSTMGVMNDETSAIIFR